MSKPLMIYLSIIATLDLIAIIMAKYWDIKNNNLFLLACIGCFALAGYFFALSLRYESAAIVNILWIAISTILVTFFAWILFKEHLSIQHIIGMIIIIAGVVVMEWK